MQASGGVSAQASDGRAGAQGHVGALVRDVDLARGRAAMRIRVRGKGGETAVVRVAGSNAKDVSHAEL